MRISDWSSDVCSSVRSHEIVSCHERLCDRRDGLVSTDLCTQTRGDDILSRCRIPQLRRWPSRTGRFKSRSIDSEIREYGKPEQIPFCPPRMHHSIYCPFPPWKKLGQIGRAHV